MVMKGDGQQGLTDTPNAGVTEPVFIPASFRSPKKRLKRHPSNKKYRNLKANQHRRLQGVDS